MDERIPSVYSDGARQGLFAGIYFTMLFFLLMLGMKSLLLSFIGEMMAIAVPVILFIMLRRRYRSLPYSASFSEIWMHGILIFFCGSLILALAIYVFLRFIHPGFLSEMFRTMIGIYKETDGGEQVAQLLESFIKTNSVPKPVDCAFPMLWLGGFSGSVLSLLFAGIIKLTNPR